MCNATSLIILLENLVPGFKKRKLKLIPSLAGSLASVSAITIRGVGAGANYYHMETESIRIVYYGLKNILERLESFRKLSTARYGYRC